MIRIAILGARGYTARELIAILLRHPEAEIVCLTTRGDDRPHVSDVHPEFRQRLDLHLENLTPAEVAKQADVVFSCLPHAASAEIVVDLVDAGVKVIDFSADYRLNDVDVYEKWYGVKHPDVKRIGNTVYGLPELFREEIKGSQLVANPGCYPTSAILALTPAFQAGMIEPTDIIIDSKSGVSGAGRNPKPNLHYPETNESIVAYGVGKHRHTPEMDQYLSFASGGEDVQVLFTPQLAPMNRGILTIAYAIPKPGVTEESLREAYEKAYSNEPFVRVVDQPPSTRQVSGSNYCDVFVTMARGRVIAISAIDNLIKGASGAAVQNFNLICGFEETTAL